MDGGAADASVARDSTRAKTLQNKHTAGRSIFLFLCMGKTLTCPTAASPSRPAQLAADKRQREGKKTRKEKGKIEKEKCEGDMGNERKEEEVLHHHHLTSKQRT